MSDEQASIKSLPTIGIVCALKLEIGPLLDQCEQLRTQTGNGFKFRQCRFQDTQIVTVEAGTGMTRARQATHALIDGCKADWILSIGFSGALVEGMQVGDIVVGNRIVHATGEPSLLIDINMPEAKGLRVGALCTAGQIIRKVSEKQTLGAKTNTIAVDMESLAVAQVCKERSVRCMAIRVISDDLTEDLPSEVTALLGPKGTIRAGALVGTLFKRPSSIKDLWKLREQAVKAATRLSDFVLSAIPNLLECR